MAAFKNYEPHSLQDILTSSSGIAHLVHRAAALKSLQERLLNQLAAPLSDHVTVANYDDQVLIIQTDSPAWAARLRFHIPELLKLAQEKCGLPSIQTIRIKVDATRREREPLSRAVTLPAEASNILRECAQSIDDPALRDSLLRLSKRT